MLKCLPVAAIILSQEGQKEWAVEVLGLAFHFPEDGVGWMTKWPLLTRLRASLEADLGSAAYADAWERGATHDLDATVKRFLAHFGETGQGILPQPPDSLSERELEILRLIADGIPTREVAERLFLSVGTVRWYLNQIYSKLDAHSRVQAIARARELNLLA